MHPDQLSSAFAQALISKGFVGIIPATKARQIVEQVTEQFKEFKFKITVDMAPIHHVGKGAEVNCARSSVKVEPIKYPAVK